jgi:NAD(P)-dependent dehydrogenase (short-subunit alcohol dehydrogenase family)
VTGSAAEQHGTVQTGEDLHATRRGRSGAESDEDGVMAGTALITGGTGGLGAAVTRRFLAGGWRVVVPWYAERELTRLDPHPDLELVQADLFEPGPVATCVEQANAEPDAPLRAVVNLVGGYAAGGRVHETPVADFEAQFRLNLRPTYLVCQATLPHLAAAGGGAVVCVSSRAAERPFKGAAGYIAAKAAVLAFADALAVEYRDDGIRVNTVLPGVIDTPANRAAQPTADHGRWVPPEQIAETIHVLCGPQTAPVTGSRVKVYGRS